MSDRLQMHAILHGAVVVLVGNLCGIPYASAIGHSPSQDVIRAWRVAHTGGVTGGLFLVALGAVLPRLTLGAVPLRTTVWAFVAGTYSITLGFVIAAVAGVRGIDPGGPTLNVVVHVAYLVGGLGVLAGSGLFVYSAFKGLRAASAR